MIDGFPLSFFLPLVVHALAGQMTGVTGIMAFRASICPGRHHRWGTGYVWAYTVVFLTATMLSVQRWEADAYLFFLAVIGYGLALCGYGARRFRQEPRVRSMLGKQWVVVHIVGMIGSYVVLWTAFFVDNAHRIPGLNQLPSLTFWVLPAVIGIPFIVLSISRFVPNIAAPDIRPRMERKLGGRRASGPGGIVLRSRLGKGGNTNDRSDSTNGIAHLCCIDPDPWNPVLDRQCSR